MYTVYPYRHSERPDEQEPFVDINDESEYPPAEEETGNELVISDQGGYSLHVYMRLVTIIQPKIGQF